MWRRPAVGLTGVHLFTLNEAGAVSEQAFCSRRSDVVKKAGALHCLVHFLLLQVSRSWETSETLLPQAHRRHIECGRIPRSLFRQRINTNVQLLPEFRRFKRWNHFCVFYLHPIYLSPLFVSMMCNFSFLTFYFLLKNS